jgi:hypothetical protein
LCRGTEGEDRGRHIADARQPQTASELVRPRGVRDLPRKRQSTRFVLHAVILGEPADCCVELLQREIRGADRTLAPE